MADAGRQVAGIRHSLRLNDETWREIQVGAYWSVYNREVAKQHNKEIIRIKKEAQDQSVQRFCPPKELLRCSAESCSGKDGKCADNAQWFPECDCEDDDTGCPKLEAMPFCDNCGGRNAVGQSCKGVKSIPVYVDQIELTSLSLRVAGSKTASALLTSKNSKGREDTKAKPSLTDGKRLLRTCLTYLTTPTTTTRTASCGSVTY